MTTRYLVGTSGYSFDDWIGTFYPAGTRKATMLERYAEHFQSVEVNYTYYRLPSVRTMESLVRRTGEDFLFWVKANQETTHKQNRGVAAEFIENIAPLRAADRLAGVLLQFPQSFHRTIANRTYLAAALADFARLPLAVEFRHRSWQHPAAAEGLRQRNVTLVIPDVPDIPDLYHSPPAATTATAYLRLHSRDASKWYGAGEADRYDYSYPPKNWPSSSASGPCWTSRRSRSLRSSTTATTARPPKTPRRFASWLRRCEAGESITVPKV